jgi:hypothetical protein
MSLINAQILEKQRPPQYRKTLKVISNAYSKTQKEIGELNGRFELKAKEYVPRLFHQLETTGIMPKVARYYIVNDCSPHWWKVETVLKWLPERAKDGVKARAGKISRFVVRENKEKEIRDFKSQYPSFKDSDITQKNLKTYKKIGSDVFKNIHSQGIKGKAYRERVVHNVKQFTIVTTKGSIDIPSASSSYRIYLEKGQLVNVELIT